MIVNCPSFKCGETPFLSPKFKSIVRNGFYRRLSDSRILQRYFCRKCGRYFSAASGSACFNQKKRRINFKLRELLCSGVSQRRAARILHVSPKTVIRRFHFLAQEARFRNESSLTTYPKHSLTQIQFDDLETSEHSKCKPLSVALAVDQKTRKILSFQVSQMSAKGLLVKKALKKYGHRRDERALGWSALMLALVPLAHPKAEFTSDENPHYPRFLKAHHPEVKHIQVKGGRGCIAGQGELKKLKFDPLFALNHTCAMLRANLNRLFRRTWCTTKTRTGLADHLAIYMDYHNSVLIKSAR